MFTLTAALRAADAPAAKPAPITMTINGQPAKVGDYAPADIPNLVLDNGLLKITFGKDAIDDFSATSIIVKGQELAHNLNGIMPRDQNAQRTFYHDYSGSNGHLHARIIRVFENQPYRVHFAIIDNGSPYLEDHYVMLPGESGIHPYVIIRSQFGGEMRTMYRFDMHILDHTWTPERLDQQLSYAYLQSISDPGNVADETWRLPANNPAGLPAGTVYSKYDWCLYYSEAPMWGHLGHGFGAWFIPVSTESYAGGPLRQDLSVHQDALILNYLGGGHLGSGGTASGRNGEKLHGPWYVYFNTGDSLDAIVADAKKTALAEEKKWPYPWMNDPLYPTKRAAVTGQLTVSHDRSAAHAYIILGQPINANGGGGGRGGRGAGTGANNTGAVQDRAAGLANQAGDYIFYVKADADGKFTLPNVRPGNYTLYAWETQGPITQSFSKDNIEVSGDKVDLGKLVWDAPYHPNLLWQIGQADRLAGEFKLGNGPRAAMLLHQVPPELTYTIGKSKEATDWYFAQRSGTWTVDFNLDKTYSGNAYLTVAIAGGQGNVELSVNGEPIGGLSYGDDGSVRRSANRSGRYGRNEITFPASLLKKGANTLTLRAQTSDSGNGLINGLMYDTLVMEAD
ncbi:MAG TPA: polysaccharide lyase family protein [Opitutales bacterium]|nr:polysaccharide lyase family protein [Opitutales bacterium]